MKKTSRFTCSAQLHPALTGHEIVQTYTRSMKRSYHRSTTTCAQCTERCRCPHLQPYTSRQATFQSNTSAIRYSWPFIPTLVQTLLHAHMDIHTLPYHLQTIIGTSQRSTDSHMDVITVHYTPQSQSV